MAPEPEVIKDAHDWHEVPANLLVQDLRDLVKSDNLLLSEFVALEMLRQAVEVERKLKRIEAIPCPVCPVDPKGSGQQSGQDHEQEAIPRPWFGV